MTAEFEASVALAASEARLTQAQKMEAIGQLTGGVAHDFNNLLQVISGNLQLLTKEPARSEAAEGRIKNAMEGTGTLTIEVGDAYLDDEYTRSVHDVTPGQYVVLSVTDTGSGIPPELLERVYEPFFSTKPEGKGTGLGLSMVYGFVKQSGGHVKIYSKVGQGTTVKLYLPRSLEAEDQIVVHDSGPIFGGEETILVVEDDTRVRETVIDTLTDLGYRVLQASDPHGALAIIESGIPIDLLFTDVVMPGRMKSTELARAAVERLPALKVLFTSGYTENSIVHAGRLAHLVELLSKPYTREALARKVRLQLSSVQPAAASQPVVEPARPAACKVLLCEDDVLIRMATVDMLEDLGHTAVETGTAKAALEALAECGFDILITDIGLPDMLGTALVERARAQVPRLAVIFATGHSTVEGFPPDAVTEILVKPYDISLLAQAISKLR